MKRSALFLSTNNETNEVIFLALWLKVICKTSLALYLREQIQGSILAGSYIFLSQVILNKSTTRRKANKTADRQYHFGKYLALQGSSQIITNPLADLFSCRWLHIVPATKPAFIIYFQFVN